jgi:[ribosomal protein S5]-alanine N-acetyltransferase
MDDKQFRIDTGRLTVRSFQEADAADLHEYLSLPATYVFEPGGPVTMEEAQRLARERSAGIDFLAVVLKAESKMIGHLYFHRIDPQEFMTWELGFIFNPGYQRKGYCTEASRALVEYACAARQVHKVVAFCNPLNLASWKVLEKIGMKREGCFEKKAFFKRDAAGNPIWHDCWAFGLLAIP